MRQLWISNTAFARLVELGIIIKDPINEGKYLSPWGDERMFRLRDIANYLTRHSRRWWTTQQLTYNFGDLIVDLHQGKSNRALNRMTLHDFRSLVLSVVPDVIEKFDAFFGKE